MSYINADVNSHNRGFVYNIPQNVLEDLSLNGTDLRVYAYVRSFMDTTGEAFFSNQWAADRLDLDPLTISRSVSKLCEKGHIERFEDEKTGQRYLAVGKKVSYRGVDEKIKGGVDEKINQLDQSSISPNNNNSEPKPRKYRHAPALAEGDVVVAKILEKAAAFELPKQSIEKVIKKHGRGAVDAALDLLAKQENINEIKNLMGWVTDAAREGWAFEQPKAQPAGVSPAIEVERYIAENRDTKLHKDALAALEKQEGIKPPVGADYKDKEYEIFFNDEYKFNVKLVNKMKELKAKK